LAKPRIGVDLGGTKIEAVVLVGDDVTLKKRVPTPRHDYRGTLQAIVDLVQWLESELGQTATVGIGMPGAISPHTARVKNANSTWLNGRRFAEDLTELMGRPLRFDNDANCFTLSEGRDGAAAGSNAVFGVILGTGVGGGLVIHGRIWSGANAVAGEWGHNGLPRLLKEEWPGPECYCGRRGCIETFLSGPGLKRDYRESTGKELDPPEILSAAVGGDQAAEAAMARYEDRLARGLSGVINLYDPDIIVLGGGMSNLERLYENVPAIWSRYVFSDEVVTRLVPALHGDSSGVRGAARLWEE
jgi:fructokinase